ncbi:MAG: hypothetical protein LQ343_002505 [Gyalolechia ehrenbergii]|nr:MAG: hypothetical protein LQ343_002505 [Gyalolechia ehrenbergii]
MLVKLLLLASLSLGGTWFLPTPIVPTDSAPQAAQRCQNYWNGAAPFCHPGGCASDAYKWWGIVSSSGNGGQCWSGKKRLCQCLAPGSLNACVPTLPPKESEHLNGLFTTCNNGCSVYVCSVKWVKFWKREEAVRSLGGGVHRRLYLCEDHPEQPHCVEPDPPPPPPQPTNTISTKPLTPDQVRAAFSQIEYGALAEILRSLGEDTNGRSQADLVDAAWNQFEASMGNLDIGQVNAYSSLPSFEQGPGSWVYYPDRIAA